MGAHKYSRKQQTPFEPARAAWLGALVAATVAAAGGCSVDRRGLALAIGDTGPTGGTQAAGTGGQVVGVGVASGGAGVATGDGAGGAGDPGPGGQSGGGIDVGGGGAPGTGGAGAAGQGGGGGRSGLDGAQDGGAGGQGGVTLTGTCDATTCANGCCMGNVCRTGRTDQRCGTEGAACAPCPACYRCSNKGVCGLAPEASWDVICSSASITPTMPSNTNGAWDTDGSGIAALPDPFCQLTRNGAAETKTRTLMNTLAPRWDQSIAPTSTPLTQSFLVSQPWEVRVMDDDFGTTTDDLVCSVAPQLTAGDFAAGAVALTPTRRCTALTIRLVCAE